MYIEKFNASKPKFGVDEDYISEVLFNLFLSFNLFIDILIKIYFRQQNRRLFTVKGRGSQQAHFEIFHKCITPTNSYLFY